MNERDGKINYRCSSFELGSKVVCLDSIGLLQLLNSNQQNKSTAKKQREENSRSDSIKKKPKENYKEIENKPREREKTQERALPIFLPD
jgi:hypothetical protein